MLQGHFLDGIKCKDSTHQLRTFARVQVKSPEWAGFDWSFVLYERPILDDEAKPKKYAYFNRLPSSITEV